MITLEKKGPIAILTLNRPDAMNALGEPGDGGFMAPGAGELAPYQRPVDADGFNLLPQIVPGSMWLSAV